MDAVARQAVEWPSAARIQPVGTHWMRHFVLMSVALVAHQNGVVGEQQRAAAAVRVVALGAVETGVRREPSLHPGLATTWIVTAEADRGLLVVEQRAPFSGVRVVARGTAPTSRRDMGKGCGQGLGDLLPMTVPAELRLFADQGERLRAA